MNTEGVFLEERTNYIIVQRRSGAIFDVWKLEDAIVEYNEKSKGWRVITNRNATFFVSGDIEIWHVEDTSSELWDMYKKYHRHTTTVPYEEMYQEVEIAEPPKKKKFPRWPYKITWDW